MLKALMTPSIAIAPMMDWNDTHCRVLHRLLTRRALLYTEMVTADAVLHGDRAHLLGFDASEHPVALQLGGSEPGRLAQAARIAADMGYDEVNLNVGCPSDRVQAGRFGACLMQEPALVAACMAAMARAVTIPVTVKCRIGVDAQDPEVSLRDLIRRCADVGVTHFAVHARKAWLDGLSPKQNRDVPPLDYPLVYRVKQENPGLHITINGGIQTLDEAQKHLAHVDGVMLGRAAYQDPGILLDIDSRFFGDAPRRLEDALEDWCVYVERKLDEEVRLASMTRHMMGLFNNRPGARAFRRHLSERAHRHGAGIEVLREALSFLQPERAILTPA
jgi:tRNA-dihydrouridine synthase A